MDYFLLFVGIYTDNYKLILVPFGNAWHQTFLSSVMVHSDYNSCSFFDCFPSDLCNKKAKQCNHQDQQCDLVSDGE